MSCEHWTGNMTAAADGCSLQYLQRIHLRAEGLAGLVQAGDLRLRCCGCHTHVSCVRRSGLLCRLHLLSIQEREPSAGQPGIAALHGGVPATDVILHPMTT
jgi:hypothetical protein